MRKIIILFFSLFFVNSAFASGKYISPLPLPSAEVLNIEIESCGTRCLQRFLKDGQIFSFIANFNKNNQTKELEEELNAIMNGLEITSIPYFLDVKKPFFTIALMFPRKAIGRYSTSTTNTILSYLLYQNARFNFEIFDCRGESAEELQSTLQNIYAKGYRQAIAVVTQQGAKELNKMDLNMQIYIPSVHKSQILAQNEVLSKNLIFGAISYEEQINFLSSRVESNAVTSFYDTGAVGQQIQKYTQNANNLTFSKTFSAKDGSNLQKEMKGLRGALSNSSVFLNTPVTNSSMILSQITYNDIRVKGVYSTQINYNPMLLSITQPNDRKNMYIANSIMPLDVLFIENAELLGVDLKYDWINYATAFGVEHFYIKSVKGVKKIFKENIKDQQVQYNIEILTPKNNRFMPL
ncbi:MAG: hypothetical protein PUB96_05520 [Helicobacteraceae bacterium]|nr:hypothetical protein [Helicobacteraceae bacterium]